MGGCNYSHQLGLNHSGETSHTSDSKNCSKKWEIVLMYQDRCQVRSTLKFEEELEKERRNYVKKCVTNITNTVEGGIDLKVIHSAVSAFFTSVQMNLTQEFESRIHIEFGKEAEDDKAKMNHDLDGLEEAFALPAGLSSKLAVGGANLNVLGAGLLLISMVAAFFVVKRVRTSPRVTRDLVPCYDEPAI